MSFVARTHFRRNRFGGGERRLRLLFRWELDPKWQDRVKEQGQAQKLWIEVRPGGGTREGFS